MLKKILSAGIGLFFLTAPLLASAGSSGFKSHPTLAQISVPSTTFTNGTDTSLLRFSITANSSGTIGLGQLLIEAESGNAYVGQILRVYGYSDPAFSQPIAGTVAGLIVSGADDIPLILSSPLEIPAGTTYYFDVRGAMTINSPNSWVTTMLLGDASSTALSLLSSLAKDSFVWSPNTNSTSKYSDSDWTNGYGVAGLPASGISQTLTASSSTQHVTFTATPTSGKAPLAVQFTSIAPRGGNIGTTVNFGDGASGKLNPVPVCASCNPQGSVGHTYTSAGTYAATLLSLSGAVLAAATTTVTSGTSTVTLTATNPIPLPFAQVMGGSTGVPVGSFTLQPLGDSVNLQGIGLSLNATDASAADIARAYIYQGATLVGSVIFTGSPVNGYYHATTTISSLTLPQNQQTVFTIKVDVAPIGAGQPGTDGHEILINLADAQGVGASAGSIVNSGPLSSPQTGVAMFRSVPTVALSSYLPSNGVEDGRLMAFTITAGTSGPIGFHQLQFLLSPSGVTVASTSLYAYVDPGFSQPVPGSINGMVGSTATFQPSGTSATTVFIAPLEIPAGATYYFLLRGTVAVIATTHSMGYSVVTTLEGDSSNLAPKMTTANGVSSMHFIWSPNGSGISSSTTADWTNGYGVAGLPAAGITETRTGGGPTTATTGELSNLASILTAFESLLQSLEGQTH